MKRTGFHIGRLADSDFAARTSRGSGEPLSDFFELTSSGAKGRGLAVYHERLAPHRRASSPHHHSHRDEFVLVLSGTLTLVTPADSVALEAGAYAVIAAGAGITHCLENRSEEEALYLLVAVQDPDDVTTYG